MFLKCLDLQGFKSFADKTHLDFTDGITSLLGPNGCGKSNIVDAIKWVLGEQSTKTLRAGRMEDVIFNGTDKRKPLPFAEVALTINNENHELPNDATEIEIKRRIFRDGNSNEYFINRQQCKLSDIRALFFDTGVGKSAYSILEQGKIDQILTKSPEERRSIFEEAAGISRFKVESIEAERKLEKANENIAQVESILKDTKRTYETRKTQAEKAIKARALKAEQFSLEVDISLGTVQSYLKLKDSYHEELNKLQLQFQQMQDKTKQDAETMNALQDEMKSHAGKRVAIQIQMKGIEEAQKGRDEKLDLLTQRFREFCRQKDQSLQKADEYKEKIDRDTEVLDDKKDALQDVEDKLSTIDEDIRKNIEALDKTKQTIADIESKITEEERNGLKLNEQLEALQREVGELTDVIVVQLDAKLKESGYRTDEKIKARDAFVQKLAAIKKSVDERSAFLSRLGGADLSFQTLASQEQTFQKNLLAALQDASSLFDQYVSHEPTFLDDLVAPEGIITKKHQLDGNIEQMRRQIGDGRDKMSQLQQEQQRLSQSVVSFQEAINQQNYSKIALQGQKNTLTEMINQMGKTIMEEQYYYDDLINASKNAENSIYDTQDSIRSVEEAYKTAKEEMEDLNVRLEEEVSAVEKVQKSIRDMQEAQSESAHALQDVFQKQSDLKGRIAGTDDALNGVYTSFFTTYGKSLKEYENRLGQTIEEYAVLQNRLTSVKKELEGLGNINQMAEDEFNEVKSQYDFLSSQLADLNKAKADLVGVVQDIKTRSADLFNETYKQISANFQDMFRRLFGGGRAELKLVPPEQKPGKEGEEQEEEKPLSEAEQKLKEADDILESGIDIFAQPPGKKLVSLSLLSGGERSMTAVALLFATYIVKPSPFCILDEIDAALDDRNIGNFLTVLQGFAQTSQFIIITHNKHTVLGSSSMLGVTQIEAGVSTTVSYRLAKEAGKPVILDDNSNKVDFTDDGVRK
ncbi:MAG: AAA family ATPase [Sphaerochaeta sp.]|jgi:chromosome segregation protein|nr:AAA family ATPase [Sphaerochaeta sp.]MCI2103679.1 AAA family ATPase [Sphaerochaeta sp.]